MAFGFINGVAAGAVGADSITTADIDMTGANLIVGCGAYGIVSGATTPSFSDSELNGYTLGVVAGAANNAAAKLAYVAAPSVSAAMNFTLTVDGTLLERPAIGVVGFSGAHASPADVEATGSGTGAQSVQALSAFTPSVDGCLIVTMIAIDRVVTNMTLTGGGLTWTLMNGTDPWVAFLSLNHPALYVGYAVQPSAAQISDLTWDWTTNAQRTAKAWAFKPSGLRKFVLH